MSWGYGSWGHGPWGGGGGSFSPGFYVSSAYASASNAVRVILSDSPLFQSPIQFGDASNLRNWTLYRADTGERLRILAVSQVDGFPNVLEFTIAGTFASAQLTYTMAASADLLSATLAPIINPKTADFIGMPFVKAVVAATRPLQDVQNPQTSKTLVNGALVVNTAGDYALEDGTELLKKLITRRLLTKQGEFYHLSNTTYGLGLSEKEFYTHADLVVLQAEIERQVVLEPEVSAARAQVELSADNQLTVRLKATLRRTGQQVSFSLPLPTNSATAGA